MKRHIGSVVYKKLHLTVAQMATKRNLPFSYLQFHQVVSSNKPLNPAGLSTKEVVLFHTHFSCHATNVGFSGGTCSTRIVCFLL